MLPKDFVFNIELGGIKDHQKSEFDPLTTKTSIPIRNPSLLSSYTRLIELTKNNLKQALPKASQASQIEDVESYFIAHGINGEDN